MGLCCALFHWPPGAFFESTPHEIYAAIEGFERLNPPRDTDGNVTK